MWSPAVMDPWPESHLCTISHESCPTNSMRRKRYLAMPNQLTSQNRTLASYARTDRPSAQGWSRGVLFNHLAAAD
jgi:hypothetical protein